MTQRTKKTHMQLFKAYAIAHLKPGETLTIAATCCVNRNNSNYTNYVSCVTHEGELSRRSYQTKTKGSPVKVFTVADVPADFVDNYCRDMGRKALN